MNTKSSPDSKASRPALALRSLALLACALAPMACDANHTSRPLSQDPSSSSGDPGTQISVPIPQPGSGSSSQDPTTPISPSPETGVPGGSSSGSSGGGGYTGAPSQGGSGQEPSGGGSGNPQNPPVPEPGTLLLVGTGLAAFAMMRGRKEEDEEQV